MLAVYIISAIVGGGLVLASALLSHGDHDVHEGSLGHGDVHVDHDGDGQADAHIWLPFLSLRFWTYFFAMFGLGGLLLGKFTDLQEPKIATFSAVTGVIVGTIVAYLMRLAKRLEAGSSVRTEDFLGRTGEVVVAIRPGSAGKVRVNLRGDIIDVIAIPNDGETLEIGSEAVIVTMESDRARVMSRAALLEETHLNA